MTNNPIVNSWLKETPEGQKICYLMEYQSVTPKDVFKIIEQAFEAGRIYEKHYQISKNSCLKYNNPS